MLIKSKLLQHAPSERAFLLVGAYIGHFALLEMGINNAIQQVLNLNPAAAMIVTRNMTFDEKIKNLRALVNFYVFDKEQAKRFDRLAQDSRKISEERNIIAHTPFHASPASDGVVFYVRSANSTLKTDDMDWSVDDFLRRIDHILETDKALREIEDRMSLQRIAQALLKNENAPPAPLGGLSGLLLQQEQEATPGYHSGEGGGPL